jgi:pimeloyl-ACP methyl ester carboxylesterase
MNVVVRGEGPPLLLVHGSAADSSTWTIQLAALRAHAKMITWDRRGHHRSPLPAGVAFFSVEQHADDAASLIETQAQQKAVVCGSSFGAVVALELCRRRPDLVRGAVLLEPPLRPTDEQRGVPEDFLSEFDRLEKESGGPAAAEFFLRTVLGDAAFEKMPRPFQERSLALWLQIRQDSAALEAYRVRYPELAGLPTPMLLLGGERSAPFYGITLRALHRALPNATLEVLTGAGHMLHAEAHRRFNERLRTFMAQTGAC